MRSSRVAVECCSPGHIHYFSGENLIGAAESIAVGALVYLLVVRPLLMASSANQSAFGKRVYINRWPAWLDLENSVYRPVLHWLPTLLSVPDRLIMGYASCFLTRFEPDHPIQMFTLFGKKFRKTLL